MAAVPEWYSENFVKTTQVTKSKTLCRGQVPAHTAEGGCGGGSGGGGGGGGGVL